MLAGVAVCSYYMAVNLPLLRSLFGVSRPLVDCQWFGVDAIAAGVFAVPVGLAVMVVVSLLGAPPDAAQLALIDRMRFPGPGER
jgi:cation/acetate symporter